MRRAKTLTDQQLNTLLTHIAATSKEPLRDYVMVLLSFKGGLRAAEIAGLSWRDVCDAEGKIGDVINYDDNGAPVYGFSVPSHIAKKGHGRAVPLNKGLQVALEAYRKTVPAPFARGANPVIHTLYGRMRPNTLQKYLGRMYRSAGFDGVSSHSGRRTFTTRAIRVANTVDCSIKDVQKIVGHRFLSTTEAYIDLSPNTGALVKAI